MRWFIYQAVPGMHDLKWSSPLSASKVPDRIHDLRPAFEKALKKPVLRVYVSYNPSSGSPYFLLQTEGELYFASETTMRVLGEVAAYEIWT